MESELELACKGYTKSRGGMNMDEIRGLCRERGISTAGTRDDILKRLCDTGAGALVEGRDQSERDRGEKAVRSKAERQKAERQKADIQNADEQPDEDTGEEAGAGALLEPPSKPTIKRSKPSISTAKEKFIELYVGKTYSIAKLLAMTDLLMEIYADEKEQSIMFGDLLYFPPSIRNFPFGHVAISHGVGNTTPVVLFRTECGTPSNTSIIDRGHTSCNVTASLSTKTGNMYVVHYIGQNAKKVRILAGLLSIMLNVFSWPSYGGFSGICKILKTRCNRPWTRKQLKLEVETYLNNFDSINLVCSGYGIIIYQLALYLLDESEDKVNLFNALPLVAKSCRPSHLYDYANSHTEYWKVHHDRSFETVPLYNITNTTWDLFHIGTSIKYTSHEELRGGLVYRTFSLVPVC
jgi:SAP domain